ncbi:MAG: beta-lactamase family protein [Gammaproteobacteria bacterium]|nr:beta-lactamase family protein [Gammaproteobacteria bacterium]
MKTNYLTRSLLCSAIALMVSACASTNELSSSSNSHPPLINPSSITMGNPDSYGIDQGEIEDIRAAMKAAVDGEFIPGALILVGNNDNIGLIESVGTQAPGDNTPIDKDTIFRIYSMTKPIISVATMTMVEDGLISLDDPVGKYIPEFSDLEVINRETGEISKAQNVMTVRHLITHKSGLIQEIFSPNTELGRLYRENVPYGQLTANEMARAIGSLPVFFEPGNAWHYGHSTDTLGAVLEVAAGKTLDVVLKERIFDPLGMDETTFWVPNGKAGRVAEPIHGEMEDNTIPGVLLSGGGGLNSTTEDYVRFAQMLLNDGEYRGQRIIDKSTLDLMLEKHITEDVSREFFFYGPNGDWGLGFHLQPTDGNNANGPHNFGWRGIGGTIFVVDKANDFFMIYMEQKRGGPRGAPFDNNVAQRMIYEAMAD